MHVSVRRYKDVADLKAFVRDVEIDFVPKLKSLPGFVAYYAVEEGSDSLTTISVFSTAAMAEDSNMVAADWVKNRAPDTPMIPVEVAAGTLAVVEPPIRG